MTTEAPTAAMTLPLLMRFAEPLGPTASHRLRYDPARQVAQVEVDGQWIDTPDAEGDVHASTLITRVARETTDDQ
jgi:hypothetical protein|nr:hypothetical protein [uncultured Albidiferax sp.]